MDQIKELSLKLDEVSRRRFVAGVAESVLGVSLLSYGTKTAFGADSEVPPPPPGGGKAKNGTKPADLAGWDSPIMPATGNKK